MFILTFSKLVANLHRGMLGSALCLFSSSPGYSASRRSGLCDRNKAINKSASSHEKTHTNSVSPSPKPF